MIIIILLSTYIGRLIHLISLNLPAQLSWQWQATCAESLPTNLVDKLLIKDAPPALLADNNSHQHTKYSPWIRHIPFSYLLLINHHNGNHGYFRRLKIEIMTVGVTALTIYWFGLNLESLLLLLLFYALIVLSLIDLEHHLLPDIIVLPLLWLGLIVNQSSLFIDINSAVIGAVAGYLSLWSIFHLHHRLTGKIGMGHGDFKLFALLGAWFGWQLLPIIIFIASVSGSLIGVLQIINNKNSSKTIAFGPHLAIAGSISYLFKDNIANYYLVLL